MPKVLCLFPRNPATHDREEESIMWTQFETPSDGLAGLLFLLVLLGTFGLVRLAEHLQELRS
jgi:hypothetical protein